MNRHLRDICYVTPALLVIGILFLGPIGRLFSLSLGETEISLRHYEELFSTAIFTDSLWRTVRISLLVTIADLLLAYPIAYVLTTAERRIRAILALMVILPFWTSILVRNYAWIYLLQRRGSLNDLLLSTGLIDEPFRFMFNEIGVVIGMSNALLPFMVLPIYVSLQAQDESYLEAAHSLGASPGRAFFSVTLPLSLAGVYAGCLLVFATALGFFVTPALLGGGKVLMAATYITQEIETYLNWPLAAAASIVLLIIVTAIIAVYARIITVQRLTGMGDGGS